MLAVPFTIAGSSGRCNTSIKSFGWGCKSQSLAWSFVELPSHVVELGLRVHGRVSPLRQVLPQQTVGVLIGTTLPRTLRIAEVNVDVGRQRQAPMVRKLLAAVPGQRVLPVRLSMVAKSIATDFPYKEAVTLRWRTNDGAGTEFRGRFGACTHNARAETVSGVSARCCDQPQLPLLTAIR
jgi:hypothetical protein